MTILLNNRTEASVRIYYERAQQPEIKAVLPQKAQNVEEAIADYSGLREQVLHYEWGEME